MKLLHLVFSRLHDNEIRSLSLDILTALQKAYLLDQKLQIELFGYVVMKANHYNMEYECSPEDIKNGWRFIKCDNGWIIGWPSDTVWGHINKTS